MNAQVSDPAQGPLAHWHAEHAHFRRLLALLQAQVDLFHAGQQPNYALMVDIIAYLRDFSDRFHHPREDAAFLCLARHLPDLDLTLARLMQEHRVIAYAGESLRKMLEAVVDGAVVARGEIEAAASTYLVYYRGHIAREEDGVLDHAAEQLTPEDWETVRAAAPAGPDPLVAPDSPGRYRELRRHIALEAPTPRDR